MYTFRIFTPDHVYNYQTETLPEAIEAFCKYRPTFEIIGIQDIMSNKLITNNIPCLIGNLNNKLF
jgi:hypothetical protein